MSSIGSVNLLSTASEQTGLLGLGLPPPGLASVLAGGFNGSESYKKAFDVWVRSLSHHELMKACSQIPTGKIREIAESAKSERYLETASRLEFCALLQIPSIGELNPVKSILLGYVPKSGLILFFDKLDDETKRDICSSFLQGNKSNLRDFNKFLSTFEIDEGHSYFDRIDISKYPRFSFLYDPTKSDYPYIMKALIKSSKFNEFPLSEFEYALGCAANLGQAKTVDVIINSRKYNQIRQDAIGSALGQSTANGHEDIALALINSSRFDDIPQAEIEHALMCAVTNNRVNIFHTLINGNRFDEISPKVLGNALERAVDRNDIVILQGLMNCRRFDEIPLKAIEKALIEAASKSYGYIFHALINGNRFDEISPKVLGEALKRAADRNKIAILQGLINCRRFDEIPLEAIEKALTLAASNRYGYIFYALIECRKFDQISPEVLGTALKSAAENISAEFVCMDQWISSARIVDIIAASDKFNEIPLKFVESALEADHGPQRKGRPLSKLLIEKYQERTKK